jgi:hypothetical protein
VPQAKELKEELDFDMRMGSIWVYALERRGKAKAEKEKPELNTEDLDYV